MTDLHTLSLLLKARHPLIALVTSEEPRALAAINREGQRLGRPILQWSVTRGVETEIPGASRREATKPGDGLAHLAKVTDSRPSILVLCDVAPYLKDPLILRALRDLAESCRVGGPARSIVMVGTEGELPADLAKLGSVCDLPLPDRHDLAKLAQQAAGQSRTDRPILADDPIVDALVGLTECEAENALALSLASRGELDPQTIAGEKRQIVRKSGALDFVDVRVGADQVGGLGAVKSWLRQRALARSTDARAYGLPTPKGALIVGVPGTGKSLLAKATAQIMGAPLIKLDLGRIYGSLVGQSEATIRSVIRTIDALGPCVVWIDEIEKGIAGGGGSGASDGGVGARVLGSLLTWLQDRPADSGAFVIATANAIGHLPPELLRKGRFDEIFSVDLPGRADRWEIAQTHLARHAATRALALLPADLSKPITIVEATDGFTGAEIEAVITSALYAAFEDGARPVQASDLTRAAEETIPLSRTMADKIEAFRLWAQDHARNASLPDAPKVRRVGSI